MFSFEEVLNLGLIAISWDFWVVIALDKSPNKDFSFALLCRLLLSCCLFSSYIFGLFCRSPIKAIWPQNRICNWSFLEILVYFAHPLPGSIMGAGSNIWPFFISLSWILTIFYKFWKYIALQIVSNFLILKNFNLFWKSTWYNVCICLYFISLLYILIKIVDNFQIPIKINMKWSR